MDILYLLLLLTFVFTLVIQMRVSSTFNKYAHIGAGRGRTGAEVARRILDAHGLFDVGIERVHGHLTDHYDPRSRVLRLSEGVYSSSSPSAVGVAAHEVGHAIQHAENYLPIRFRTKLVPVVNFASRFSWIAIVLGLFITYSSTILGNYVVSFGILLFATTTLFHLVTLPCEFNASRRALTELELSGWYSESELGMSRKVLRAAAMTYVAALATSIIQLLRLIRIFGNRRD
jgi:Zn-dependent membrane protease YugP